MLKIINYEFPIQCICKGDRGLIISNSLAAIPPELVREWSDENLPFTSDKIACCRMVLKSSISIVQMWDNVI